MKYVGSKARYSKEILPIILKDRENRWYVEPFCGACNLIDKVDGDRIGNDSHYYLIELFKAIQRGWTPPDFVSEDTYSRLKVASHTNMSKSLHYYPPDLIGFVGFGCSFSGKWFGGYARGAANDGRQRNYCFESKKNILAQQRGIQDVILFNGDYRATPMPDNSIIYCDPPYRGTQGYGNDFNHNEFFEWCRMKANEGHIVYVSEYHAPEDFECVWEKKVFNTLDKNTGSKTGIERLFRCRTNT